MARERVIAGRPPGTTSLAEQGRGDRERVRMDGVVNEAEPDAGQERASFARTATQVTNLLTGWCDAARLTTARRGGLRVASRGYAAGQVCRARSYKSDAPCPRVPPERVRSTSSKARWYSSRTSIADLCT